MIFRPCAAAHAKALSTYSMQPTNGSTSPNTKYGTGMRTASTPRLAR